ncbi:lantibiotic dehydratase C-terminal domain-containing protein [Streptomyces sp. RFCAC02]|uniref:lantibiotic dehydratase C-terminal domain-containing protein n=1 Tax=Streptomyces sp. RFCAC02 TaxID=2499143 RepID=UPI0010215636|nr:lantibiotic dehydratase C-terminal domain-containing protein [Streptomyces sp. RFCAC02]
MNGDPRWVSAHLFHDGDLDLLARRVVAPVVHEARERGLLRRHFFLRYWEGGLHVRLRLLPTAPEAAPELRRLVGERAAAHFATTPSVRAIGDERYAELAARMAAGERLTSYETALRPPDSVADVPYRPEYDAYGDASCLDLVEQHFTESADIALALIGSGAGRQARARLVLAALTCVLAVCEPRHDLAAAAFAGSAPGRASRAGGPAGAQDHYARHADRLTAQTRALWERAATRRPAPPDPAAAPLAAWTHSIAVLRDGLLRRRAEGAFDPRDPGSPPGALAMAIAPDQRPVGLVLLRCAHLLSNRLGVTADHEGLLAFLLARTLLDLAGPAAPQPVPDGSRTA